MYAPVHTPKCVTLSSLIRSSVEPPVCFYECVYASVVYILTSLGLSSGLHLFLMSDTQRKAEIILQGQL